MKRPAIVILSLLGLLAGSSALAVRGDTEAARQGWALVAQGAQLVDVRTTEEFAKGHIPGAINIPMDDEEAWADWLAGHPEQSLVLYCGSGRRAGRVIERLEQQGFGNAFNATGLEALQETRTAD